MVRLALPGCLILRVLSLAGYTHAYRVMSSAVPSHVPIDTRVERETPVVWFLAGDRVFTHGLCLSPAPIRPYEQRMGRVRVMPTAAIQDMAFMSGERGAAEAFIVGAVPGGTTGFFVVVPGMQVGLLGTLTGVVSAVGDVYILDLGPTESGTGE